MNSPGRVLYEAGWIFSRPLTYAQSDETQTFDPLQDIRDVQHVSFVMKEGKVFVNRQK
jgi:hypothetical protein